MKIFIFGAGASKAAQNQVTYGRGNSDSAPLADELFSEQYQDVLIHGLNIDINECRQQTTDRGVEEWLTDKWKNIDSLTTELARHSERSWFGHINLYLWNILNKVSHTYPDAQGYTPLLRKLYDTKFGIISFNYDRHRNDTATRLREIAENIYNGAPMSLDQLEILDPKHQSLNHIGTVMEYFSREGYFYPLMFMPLTGKDYGVIADFKEVMVTKAEEMLSEASEVYFIGYRASDELIHELLKKVPANTKLHVVGRDMQSITNIFNRTSSRNPNLVHGTLYDAGFSSFVESF